VTPDLQGLAQGLARGDLPLAATLSTEEIYEAFLGPRATLKQFFHGHTFTANPLACAVGLESLALLREETLAHAQRQLGEITTRAGRLRELPGVRDVRQCGLMVGIDLVSRETRLLGAEVCERARRYGVILRPLGDVVVWMPPLTIRDEEIELLEQATRTAIAEVC
jgi:adenosylmethionine-8-amino-7-oxononanoate aminotransferase